MQVFLAGASPLTLNGTYIVELVIFVVMLGLLARFVYPRIDASLTARQDQIAEQIAAAERTQKEAQQRLDEALTELATARRQAQEVLSSAAATGEGVRQDLARRAQEDADRLVERARQEIEMARQQALDGVRGAVSELVVEAASRLVQAELDVQKHRGLIEDAVKRVEALGKTG
ncbi:MAG: F0F1 ATP synthase subunit B [Candidatus Dormibacteria bacterium]